MIALIQEAAAQAARGEPLSAGGWIMMILSIGSVTALTVWCFVRVLTHPENKEPKLPGGLGP